MLARRAPLTLFVALAALAVAGCGSDDDPRDAPPPARAAVSPPLTERPAGRVVELDSTPRQVDVRDGDIEVTTDEAIITFDAQTLGERRREPAPLAAPSLADAAAPELDPRARTVTVGRRSVAAGIGPTHVVQGADGRIYVADTAGGSVLYIRSHPDLKIARRAEVPASPFALTIDREKGKLWVTSTGANRIVQLTADALPRIQREYASVRQPDDIAIDDATGTVAVIGTRDRVLQVFQGYPAP